ncbi:MAG: hypothetical protein KGH72_05390 [Candidatus Micrarchaeota archaeon]|nr:hypothetical protein [Candidatus Micrarchaeota archaeon]
MSFEGLINIKRPRPSSCAMICINLAVSLTNLYLIVGLPLRFYIAGTVTIVLLFAVLSLKRFPLNAVDFYDFVLFGINAVVLSSIVLM